MTEATPEGKVSLEDVPEYPTMLPVVRKDGKKCWLTANDGKATRIFEMRIAPKMTDTGQVKDRWFKQRITSFALKDYVIDTNPDFSSNLVKAEENGNS